MTKLKRRKLVHQKKLEPGELKPLTGAHDDVLSQALCNQLHNAFWFSPNYTERDKDEQTKAALCALEALKPTTEAEGMLAVQMVACHWNTMECHRRAMHPDQPTEQRQQYLNLANKLSRTYAQLLETLDKHRGKGQQKVTVEHVHVHQGGQAIVGNVETGGGASKTKDQAHAQITHAAEPAMRSTLTENREALPQRRNEER